MKSRSIQQQKEAVEVIAANAHRMMTDARHLLDCDEHVVAMSIARAAFPLAVQAIHQRSLPRPNKNLLHPTTGTTLKGLKCNKQLTDEQFDALWRANVVCAVGWDGVADARHIVDTALAMLDLTEPQNRKKRRQEAAQAAPKRFSFPRWAAGLVGVAGTTAS